MKIFGLEIIKSQPNQNKIIDNDEKSFIYPTQTELYGSAVGKRLPAPESHQYHEYLKTYSDSEWVYACVSRITDDISNLPITIKSIKNNEIINKHKILEVLNKPNPLMTRKQLFEWIVGGLELCGNSYLYKDLANKTIWPLIPSMVNIVPSGNAENPIKQFEYNVGTNKAIYLPENIIHFKYYNPYDLYYGLAPLASARRQADTQEASSKWNLAFFNGSAEPSSVLECDKNVSLDLEKRLLNTWNDKHRGEDKAHRVALLQGGVKLKTIGISQRDMDFVNLSKMSRETTCSIFKVPPAIVGVFEYANYANSKEQLRFYWQNMLPKIGYICEKLTNELLQDANNYITFEKSGISALREDETERSQSADRYQRMGFSQNEIIRALNLPFPILTGEADNRNTPQYLLINQGFGSGMIEPEKQQKSLTLQEASKVSGISVANLRKHQREIHVLFNKETIGVSQMAKDHIEKQKNEALKELKVNPNSNSSDIYDKAKENKSLVNSSVTILKNTIEKGMKLERNFLNKIIGKKVKAVKSPARVNLWVENFAMKWSTEINKTTYKKLDDLLKELREDGAGIAEISKEVADFFDIEKDYRSDRIAQTETMAALNESSLEVYRDEPLVEFKGWLATIDNYTRESHIEAGIEYGPNGNPISVDEDFIVGEGAGPAPCQLGVAGEDINCRCTIFPVVKKGE